MTATLEGGEWSAACPSCTLPPWKDLVPILQEAGWAPGLVWTDGKSRPHRDLILDNPASSQSLEWLSYPAHSSIKMLNSTTQQTDKRNKHTVNQVKVFLVHTTKAYRGSRGIAPLILNLCTKWRWVVNIRTSYFTWRKYPWNPSNMRLGGPQGYSTKIFYYTHAWLNDGDTFWEMRH